MMTFMPFCPQISIFIFVIHSIDVWFNTMTAQPSDVATATFSPALLAVSSAPSPAPFAIAQPKKPKVAIGMMMPLTVNRCRILVGWMNI